MTASFDHCSLKNTPSIARVFAITFQYNASKVVYR